MDAKFDAQLDGLKKSMNELNLNIFNVGKAV